MAVKCLGICRPVRLEVPAIGVQAVVSKSSESNSVKCERVVWVKRSASVCLLHFSRQHQATQGWAQTLHSETTRKRLHAFQSKAPAVVSTILPRQW